ncbi:MAG: GyrI-like domain-containing protein [Opitutales bacterium]|nr:GyrI-like domain-containing protein [Opitutales bacterium]
MSVWYFQRIFAAITGEPVGAYIRRRRLTEAARELRRERGRRVLDIALDYGFDSHEAFTRAFASLAGMPPSAFRRRASVDWIWCRAPGDPRSLQPIRKRKDMYPNIIKLPEIRLVGLTVRFVAPGNEGADNMEVIPPLWEDLLKREDEIEAVSRDCSYGACREIPKAQRHRDGEFLYMAGFEVGPGTPVPQGMDCWVIPAATYACFVHRGPVSQLGETMSAIYGNWLPRSEYLPGGTPELERYDNRFKGNAADSELDILVPVVPS